MKLQNPIQQAHSLWAEHFTENCIAIDATCGNGKDALFIALGIIKDQRGTLYCLDIQKEALDTTQKLLLQHITDLSRVHFIEGSHASLPINSPVDLIVYNLGYLPGGNKALTTETSSTLASLQQACQILSSAGLISITCYPGHPEGALEAIAIEAWAQKLDKTAWLVVKSQWLNRSRSPFNIFIKRI